MFPKLSRKFFLQLPGIGLVIEKGTSIYVSVNATNQDPRYFSNPQDFIPLRTDTEDKKFHESLPFGVGPRSCIGWYINLLQNWVS